MAKCNRNAACRFPLPTAIYQLNHKSNPENPVNPVKELRVFVTL